MVLDEREKLKIKEEAKIEISVKERHNPQPPVTLK
jgi:hypothetical protein